VFAIIVSIIFHIQKYVDQKEQYNNQPVTTQYQNLVLMALSQVVLENIVIDDHKYAYSAHYQYEPEQKLFGVEHAVIAGFIHLRGVVLGRPRLKREY